MFINVTNYPSVDWEKHQLDEAVSYGEVKDLRFPEINSGWSSSDVIAKAQAFAERIVKIIWESDDVKNGVLVMGEPSFSYALIQELQYRNIKVLCATYDIELYEDEEMIQRFVKFREYSVRIAIEEDE